MRTFYLHYPPEFSLQPCSVRIMAPIVKMNKERSSEDSYLSKVKQVKQLVKS